MTQLIKPNDLVYIPHFSTYTRTVVECNFHNRLYVNFGYKKFYFLPSGKVERDDIAPLVYLATQENKANLEEFYGITLEGIPVNEELEKFSKALNEISYFYANLYLSDGNVNPSKNRDELKSIKDKLIEIFKKRGEK